MNTVISTTILTNPGSAEIVEAIGNLGGEDALENAKHQLLALPGTVRQSISAYPSVYEVTDQESIERALQLEVKKQELAYLQEILSSLYHKKGYVKIYGNWVHKSMIAFALYSAIVVPTSIPILAVLLFATTAWSWLQAIIGFVIVIALGYVMYRRARK